MLLKNTYLIEDKFDFKCEEYVNALIASWYGKGYDMMFANTIELDIGQDADCLINACIDNDEWAINECLTKYHGVLCQDVLSKYDHDESIIEQVISAISKGNPLALYVNTENILSIDEEDKIDPINVIIITGFDEEEKQIYFRVMHGRDKYVDMITMSYAELIESALYVRKFDNISSEMSGFILDEFIRETADKLKHNKIPQKLKAFNEYFNREADYQEIFKGISESQLKTVPLIYNMALLYRSRALYSFSLSYLAKLYELPDLLELADYCTVLAGKYYNVRGLALKAFYKSNLTPTIKENIIKFIGVISKMEETALEKLNNISFQVMEEHTFYNNKNSAPKQFYFLSISKSFNNKGLNSDRINSEQADFDGIGGFFVDEYYPYGQIINLNKEMKFKISSKQPKFDNISCVKQKIIPEQRKYSSIMLMASACHGSFKDYIKLTYADGEAEELLIFCSSFWYPKAHFGESDAWAGEYVMYINESYYIEQRHLNIYANEYRINQTKELVSIELPDCPDMHIFAITMSSEI